MAFSPPSEESLKDISGYISPGILRGPLESPKRKIFLSDEKIMGGGGGVTALCCNSFLTPFPGNMPTGMPGLRAVEDGP